MAYLVGIAMKQWEPLSIKLQARPLLFQSSRQHFYSHLYVGFSRLYSEAGRLLTRIMSHKLWRRQWRGWWQGFWPKDSMTKIKECRSLESEWLKSQIRTKIPYKVPRDSTIKFLKPIIINEMADLNVPIFQVDPMRVFARFSGTPIYVVVGKIMRMVAQVYLGKSFWKQVLV